MPPLQPFTGSSGDRAGFPLGAGNLAFVRRDEIESLYAAGVDVVVGVIAAQAGVWHGSPGPPGSASHVGHARSREPRALCSGCVGLGHTSESRANLLGSAPQAPRNNADTTDPAMRRDRSPPPTASTNRAAGARGRAVAILMHP